MTKNLFIFCMLLIGINTSAQNEPKLLGQCNAQDFEKEPYASWFTPNYENYKVEESCVKRLTKLNTKKYSVKVFFGSWCGDSKREVPRFLKMLNTLAFPAGNIQLIGVDSSMPVTKQSPQHEERGLEIYRVPTFIVYEKGKEIGRIVEYPVQSLERDLFSLLTKENYVPNYFSYPVIQSWIDDGTLTDDNVSVRGLAGQLRSQVSGESELNSCGYVLLASGKVKESITVFRINVSLFPQSANCLDSLGEAYMTANQNDKAIQAYEAAQKLQPENENVKKQLLKLKGS